LHTEAKPKTVFFKKKDRKNVFGSDIIPFSNLKGESTRALLSSCHGLVFV